MVGRLCGTGCRNTNRWSDHASGECHTTVLKDRFLIFRRLSLLLVESSCCVGQENELRACSTVWAIGLIRATCSGIDFDLFPLNALYLLFLYRLGHRLCPLDLEQPHRMDPVGLSKTWPGMV